jgi:hypothetical protein
MESGSHPWRERLWGWYLRSWIPGTLLMPVLMGLPLLLVGGMAVTPLYRQAARAVGWHGWSLRWRTWVRFIPVLGAALAWWTHLELWGRWTTRHRHPLPFWPVLLHVLLPIWGWGQFLVIPFGLMPRAEHHPVAAGWLLALVLLPWVAWCLNHLVLQTALRRAVATRDDA